MRFDQNTTEIFEIQFVLIIPAFFYVYADLDEFIDQNGSNPDSDHYV